MKSMVSLSKNGPHVVNTVIKNCLFALKFPTGAHPRPQAQARAALTDSQWPWVRLLICVGIPTQRLGRTAYAISP